VWGPVVGAFVIYYLVDRTLDGQPVLQALLSGVLIILVISVAPGGIVGLIEQGWSRLKELLGRRQSGGSRAPVQAPEAVRHA